jgi:hypothetical protein
MSVNGQFAHPICGDSIYGQPSRLIARQALHAGWTFFLQPRTLARMQFEVSLTTDMQNLLAQIEEGDFRKVNADVL